MVNIGKILNLVEILKGFAVMTRVKTFQLEQNCENRCLSHWGFPGKNIAKDEELKTITKQKGWKK